MPSPQLHRFIDLAASKQPDDDASTERKSRATETTRRSVLSAAAGVAAVTAMAPEAFARNFGPDAEPVRYPEPDVVPLDGRFRYKLGNTPILRAPPRHVLGRGAGLERGRALPPLE